MQGTFYGQKVFVADVESLDRLTILELDWSAGWQTHTCSTWDLTATNLLMELVHAGWATFHIRLLLFESSTGFTHVERILREAAFSCEFFQRNYIVIEMSRLQCTRMGEIIPLAADTPVYPGGAVVFHSQSLALSLAGLFEKAMERERYTWIFERIQISVRFQDFCP